MTRTDIIQRAMELSKYVRKGNMGDPPCKDAMVEFIDLFIEFLRMDDRWLRVLSQDIDRKIIEGR